MHFLRCNYNRNNLVGVFLKETDELIGTIYSYDENIAAKVGFISYCFGSKFWEMVIPLKRLRLFCSMALMKSVITISQSL